MSDIADLQQRVQKAGERISRLAEQDQKNGERLTLLVNALEDQFNRSRAEIERLSASASRAQDENARLSAEVSRVQDENARLDAELAQALKDNQKLLAMLQSLLDAAEPEGQGDLGDAVLDLESRITQIVPGAPEPDAPAGEPLSASAEGDAPESGQAEAPKAAAPAEEEAPEPSPAAEEAPDDAEAAGSPADDEGEAARPPSGAESAASGSRPESMFSAADLSAVNKIIQRISLLTGEFVDEGTKSAAAAGPKPGDPQAFSETGDQDDSNGHDGSGGAGDLPSSAKSS